MKYRIGDKIVINEECPAKRMQNQTMVVTGFSPVGNVAVQFESGDWGGYVIDEWIGAQKPSVMGMVKAAAYNDELASDDCHPDYPWIKVGAEVMLKPNIASGLGDSKLYVVSFEDNRVVIGNRCWYRPTSLLPVPTNACPAIAKVHASTGCTHPNKYKNTAMTVHFWVCPDCGADLGDC